MTKKKIMVSNSIGVFDIVIDNQRGVFFVGFSSYSFGTEREIAMKFNDQSWQKTLFYDGSV